MDALGRRSIAHYGGCIGELTFSMLDQDLMRSSRILHLGVMEEELMLEIARFCGEQEGVLLSIDGGNLSLALAEKLLPYTCLLYTSYTLEKFGVSYRRNIRIKMSALEDDICDQKI